ncbi:type II secretion system F family protein [Paenibacillus sp.]|uniref:type II secretion system F family protein n=1 Tax=Paenibacillus sp. TaxID=58172 RepID=UPI002D549A5F|nr:type II secretion system F family protein [Paenibacillus sp.]HZG56027.1 type II secretion system F family protein [Paenibacillus sp.]
MAALVCILAAAAAALWTYRRLPAADVARFLGEKPSSAASAKAYAAGMAVAAAWLRWTGGYSLLIAQLPQLARYCAIVYGRDKEADPAHTWTVETFAMTAAAGLATVTALMAAADAGVASFLAAVSAAIPFLRWRDLAGKAAQRREAFVAELPTFMHKLSLLLAAGETLHGAWRRAGEAYGEKRLHPLYAELAKAGVAMANGVPFPRALEEMQRRCGFPEVSALVTTVLMHYKRGGESFALALQDASRSLLEKKQAYVRTKGEQASAKLLFPMMLMLVAVMTIVAAPAVMMMR